MVSSVHRLQIMLFCINYLPYSIIINLTLKPVPQYLRLHLNYSKKIHLNNYQVFTILNMNILYLYFAINNFTVYKSKKDYPLEKTFTLLNLKETITFTILIMVYLFSCKGYAVSKLYKSINKQIYEYFQLKKLDPSLIRTRLITSINCLILQHTSVTQYTYKYNKKFTRFQSKGGMVNYF